MISRDARYAWVCAAFGAAAILASWPIAEMPFNDDWSYAFTALRLEQTGRILYNGWSAPILIPQVAYGALLIRLFGFSFTLLRLGMLPLAMLVPAMVYLLARRAGLETRWSVMAALLLPLSPLYLPLSASFMTDVPALAMILLAIFLFTKAAEAASPMAPMLWLCVASVVGILGGMDRQTVWLVPLTALPYVALVHRRRWPVVACAALLLIAVALDMWLSMRWYARQPFTMTQQPTLQSMVSSIGDYRLWLTILAFGLTLLLLILPMALPLAIAAASEILHRRNAIARPLLGAILLPIGLAALIVPRMAPPWLGNMLDPHGILGQIDLVGRPLVAARPMRSIFGAIVILTMVLLLFRAAEFAWQPGRIRQAVMFLCANVGNRPGLWMLMLFSASYAALLISRCSINWIYDRYTLPLVPAAAIGCLLAFRSVDRRIATVGWITLALYGCVAIAATQELFSMDRARHVAAQLLQSEGVPPARISDGFEYDYWTQLLASGAINNRDVHVPRDFFRPDIGLIPEVRPLFIVRFAGATSSWPIGKIGYFSLLPPFRREIYIYRNLGKQMSPYN